jgi:protein TonB
VRWRVALIASFACAVFGISAVQAQDSDRVYKSGDPGVVLPKVIHQVAAKYSQSAQDQGITGAVTLACEVDKEGKPRNITVIEGVEEGLDRNAAEALREFRFDPATLDGKPVVFAVRITIRFRLE